MTLLSREAIDLLERLPVDWTPLDRLELDGADAALAELKREGLAEIQVWPPPVAFRDRRRGFDPSQSALAQAQRWEARKTQRGGWRLARIKARARV